MTLTAVAVLRIHRPRLFAALAMAVFVLGSCDSGEGETPPDRAATPAERAEGDGAVAEAPVDGENRGGGDRETGGDVMPPADGDAAAANGHAGNGIAARGHLENDPGAVAPVVAPSPPPRPSPVADAPPPSRPAAPPLSREQAIDRASRPPVGDEVGSLVACGDVAEAYDRLMTENRSCTGDDDCRITEGSCAIGLGGCWYAVDVSVGYDDADRLATRYRELACNGPVCRCAAPPARAVCDEGVCTAAP